MEKKHRVLYLPIFEQGWDIQRTQKTGLREALERTCLVVEYDYLTRNAQEGKQIIIEELRKICADFMPDIVLAQIHTPDVLGPFDINILKGVCQPSTVFVNWNGDYWPDNLISDKGIELSLSFDLQLTVNMTANEELRSQGVRAEYWQIGWEPKGTGCTPIRTHDIVFLANGYSKQRQQIVRKIKDWNYDFGLWGMGWPDGWAKGQNLYDFETACKIYSGAKLSLGDSQWPDARGYVSNRVMQALAAGGSAFVIQKFLDMEQLGLIDGDTVIVWENLDELKTKIDYYLANDNERQAIANRGQQLAFDRHSFDVRVQELFNLIGINKEVEEWR